MSELLVAAPLRFEALAIKAGARRMRVRHTGMGPARSKAAVPPLWHDPAVALVVMGVCGGLDEDCEPGDVVIADELLEGELSATDEASGGGECLAELECEHDVQGGQITRRTGNLGGEDGGDQGDPGGAHVSEDGGEHVGEGGGEHVGEGGGERHAGETRIVCPAAEPLAAALQSRGVKVRRGTIVSVARIVRGETRAMMRERGAIVVDMESVWLAPAAHRRPFAVIRVVADTPARDVTRPLLTLAGAARAALSLRRTAAALDMLVREHGVHAVLGGG